MPRKPLWLEMLFVFFCALIVFGGIGCIIIAAEPSSVSMLKRVCIKGLGMVGLIGVFICVKIRDEILKSYINEAIKRS